MMRFVLIFCFMPSVSAMSFDRFEMSTMLNGYKCTGSTLLFDKTDECRSFTDCMYFCSSSSACHGFFYSPMQQKCLGCTWDVRQGLINPDLILDTGPTTFTLNILERTHGRTCIIHGDCGTNQYCGATGICTCDPGLKYFSILDSCNTNCIVFGNTYEMHSEKNLNRHNIYTNNAGMTEQECEDRCTGHPDCRSYEIKDITPMKCSLHGITALERPEDFIDEPLYTYFDRNCA